MGKLNHLIGRTIPWLTLGMVVVTFTVVIFRYVFERGWVWMQELVVYMHAFTFLFASAYALRRDAHVRVDILYRPLSKHGKAMVDLCGNLLLLLPTSVAILYYAVPFALESWRVLEGSKDGGGLEALFLLKSAIPVFCLLLILQALSSARRAVSVLNSSAL